MADTPATMSFTRTHTNLNTSGYKWLPTDRGQSAQDSEENVSDGAVEEEKRIRQAHEEAKERLAVAERRHSKACKKAWKAADDLGDARERERDATHAYDTAEEQDRWAAERRWNHNREAAERARQNYKQALNRCDEAKDVLIEAKGLAMRAARAEESMEEGGLSLCGWNRRRDGWRQAFTADGKIRVEVLGARMMVNGVDIEWKGGQPYSCWTGQVKVFRSLHVVLENGWGVFYGSPTASQPRLLGRSQDLDT